MTSNEFVIWMKGIVTASNNYNITPATWDDIKQQLEKVTNDIPLSNTSHQVFNSYIPIGASNVSSTIK
jgi:hypothetical protein